MSNECRGIKSHIGINVDRTEVEKRAEVIKAQESGAIRSYSK
jgi:hypothetical protein